MACNGAWRQSGREETMLVMCNRYRHSNRKTKIEVKSVSAEENQAQSSGVYWASSMKNERGLNDIGVSNVAENQAKRRNRLQSYII